MKHLKILGLAAIAALALTAWMGAASASALTFTSESAPITVTGKQTETAKFTTSAGTISCTGGTFNGTQATTSATTQTTSIAYSGCTFLGVFGVVVNTTGCNYVFKSAGTVDVECAAGKAITFSAVGCTVTVGAQTGLSKVSYSTTGTTTTREIVVSPAVTNIKYHTGTGCPGGTVNGTTGTYENGKSTVTGESGAKHVGVFTS
jgi:hypothetical protein